MSKFITRQEHYCPFLEKNIVIEREIIDDHRRREGTRETHICLNNHECNCVDACKNKLLDVEIRCR